MGRILKKEAALSLNYVPEKLPHREKHLESIKAYLSGFIEEPGSTFPRIIITGRPGSGKTVTCLKFGEWVNRASNGKVKYVHVSCFSNRTLASVLKAIAVGLNVNIPTKGLSTEEMLKVLLDVVRDKDLYAIVTLDDVFHLVNHGGPYALGTLIKLNEEYMMRGDSCRFGFILVSQDLSFKDQLDKSSQSVLGNTIIEFEPYTKEQIFDILLTRAQEALYDNTYDEEILEMIADVAGVDNGVSESQRGDARFAIEVLWRAAKLAEMRGSDRIVPEHVREAIKMSLRGIRIDELRMLPTHEKLFLLAIVRCLKKNPSSPYVPFGTAESEYQLICEQYGESPRRHTQLWEYLKDLKAKGFVETRISGKGMRGRTTLISIPSEPLTTLEEELKKALEGELGR